MNELGNGRPRIRHLTSVHPTDDSRIVHRECKSLMQAGHDVAVIAGREPQSPVDDVPIIGVGEPRGRADRVTRVVWNVYRAARRDHADICHLHDPELLPIGILLKLRGHKVIYDVHEDVPKQIMDKFWIPWWAKRFLALMAAFMEWVAASVFDAIVAATPSIARRFPAKKTVIVQNFPWLSATSNEQPGLPFAQRPYAFTYTGGMTAVQGIREMVDAAGMLPDDLGGAVLAGWFDNDEVENEVRASDGWKAVRYLGELSPPEVLATIRGARCGVVPSHPIANYLECYSTKMFEYMACGVPVVCSNFPMWQQLIGEADCGIVVDPLDPKAIAAAVESLSRDPAEAQRLGENGRKAVIDRYSWEPQAVKLNELYQRLA